MKHCPTCNRTYDDAKAFCGLDGTRLVEDAPAPHPAQQYSQPVATHAPPQVEQQGDAQQRAARAAAADPLERIRCEWCQAMNEKTALSCRACGAPLDVKNLISESGWREAPRIKDMTEFHFGASTCQV